MAENKVRKGFFFYLLIFLLLVIGFFAVTIVVMICKPNTNILGFKFFKYNVSEEIVKTTDTNVDLKLAGFTDKQSDFTQYSRIEVTSDVANVVFENSDHSNQNSIIIVNKSSGFAKASDEIPFNYSVTVNTNRVGSNEFKKILKIDISSKLGFLNFSDQIEVRIQLTQYTSNKPDGYPYAPDEQVREIFKNTDLVVKTKSGNVNIGGTGTAGHIADVKLKSIDVQTDSGNITLSSHLYGPNDVIPSEKPEESEVKFDKLSLRTNSGSINLNSHAKFSADTATNLKLKNGSLSAKKLGDVYLEADDSKINASDIGALTGILKSTHLNVKNISSLDLAAGSEIMDNCKIYVDKVAGIVNIPQARNSDIAIKEVAGNMNIHTTGGDVTIGEKKNDGTYSYLTQAYIKTTSGNITAYVKGVNQKRVFIADKGNISLYYPDLNQTAIGFEDYILSQRGKINLYFKSTAKLKFSFEFVEQAEDEEFDLGKVNFDILNGGHPTINPYYYNCDKDAQVASFKVITNGSVNLDLI